MPNRLNPVYASPHLTPNPIQTGLPLMRGPQHVTASAGAGDDVMSTRRHISLMPEGKINIISDTDSLQDDSISIASDLSVDFEES